MINLQPYNRHYLRSKCQLPQILTSYCINFMCLRIMQYSAIFMSLMLSEIVCFSRNNTNTLEVDVRIVGGEDCPISNHPYLISIRFGVTNIHRCGGSIINSNWILTAAHCFFSLTPIKNYLVVGGISDMYIMDSIFVRETILWEEIEKQPDFYGQKRQLVFKCMHESYTRQHIPNYDIGLAKVAKPFIMTKFVNLATLPTQIIEPSEHNHCLATGWGEHQQKNKNKVPDYSGITHLQCIMLPVITTEDCRMYITQLPVLHKVNISDHIMCTLFPSGGKDACQGDSGGPLVCNLKVYGIVSYGYGCAMPMRPGIYTRVDKFLGWIENTINTYDKRSASTSQRILFVKFNYISCLILIIIRIYIV